MNEKLIVKIKFGSHLYGTDTSTSDIDYKSVYVPSARDILLQRVNGSIAIDAKNKAEGERNCPGDVDNEIYSLQRFLGLLAEGQTVSIDMLFANKLEFSSELWEYIKQNKEKLLTKKSAAFVGYCRTQANKYGIKGSRVAAAKEAVNVFTFLVNSFGNQSKVGDHFKSNDVIDEHTYTTTKETTKGNIEDYFVCCDRMVGFKNTVKEALSIYSRVYANYGDRAKLAESNEGIDWKALSHAVRVGNEALELLNTGNINFPLPYAAHLLDIKQGKLAYRPVAEEIEQLLIEVEKASETSKLREIPDFEFIDNLVYDVYLGECNNEK